MEIFIPIGWLSFIWKKFAFAKVLRIGQAAFELYWKRSELCWKRSACAQAVLRKTRVLEGFLYTGGLKFELQ
jgi:hypothetical protein